MVLKKRRRRIKKSVYLIILIIVIGIIIMIWQPWKKKEIFMQDLSNMTVEQIKKYSKDNQLKLKIIEKNDFDISKDHLISQSIPKNSKIIKNQNLEITISLGPIDKKIYEQNKIDESGNVPIMMYHGIVNEKSSYIGGNVDKDGYNRTAVAFKKDLEFFYQNDYYMISLNDYVDGTIDVPLGKSPIILTFDDGNENNIKVTGLDKNGDILIDPNSAIGILESFKKEHPEYSVTATFFVTSALFNQPEYNEKILKWLIKNNYDIGNHSSTHANFTKISENKSIEEIGKVYKKLDQIIPKEYVNIVALPFGTPYNENHPNFKHIIEGKYEDVEYKTKATLRVGWESDYSPFHKKFNAQFLKRIRAYDNNGTDFDIIMNFNLLKDKRYISDGDKDTIVIPKSKETLINNSKKRIITY